MLVRTTASIWRKQEKGSESRGTFKRPFVGPVNDVRFSFKNGKHYLVVSVCAPLAHINTCIEFDFRYSLNLSKCACSITDN